MIECTDEKERKMGISEVHRNQFIVSFIIILYKKKCYKI